MFNILFIYHTGVRLQEFLRTSSMFQKMYYKMKENREITVRVPSRICKAIKYGQTKIICRKNANGNIRGKLESTTYVTAN